MNRARVRKARHWDQNTPQSAGPTLLDAGADLTRRSLHVRFQLGRVEPHLLFGGGYSTFGGLDNAIDGVRAGLDIDGANLRAGLGLDWFATPELSIGARGTAEALFLSRRAVPIRDLARPREVGTLSEARARILEAEGSTAGAAYPGGPPALLSETLDQGRPG
jgi:hypothetical protein